MKFTTLTAVAASLLSLGSVMAQPIANPSDLETSSSEAAHVVKRCEGPCAIWCDGMAIGPDERTVRNACRACRIVNWFNGHNGGCDG